MKSNIGHLEGASGLAGLLKTILVLEKGVIPPNTNFESLNPKIEAERLNLKVHYPMTKQGPFMVNNCIVQYGFSSLAT